MGHGVERAERRHTGQCLLRKWKLCIAGSSVASDWACGDGTGKKSALGCLCSSTSSPLSYSLTYFLSLLSSNLFFKRLSPASPAGCSWSISLLPVKPAPPEGASPANYSEDMDSAQRESSIEASWPCQQDRDGSGKTFYKVQKLQTIFFTLFSLQAQTELSEKNGKDWLKGVLSPQLCPALDSLHEEGRKSLRGKRGLSFWAFLSEQKALRFLSKCKEQIP